MDLSTRGTAEATSAEPGTAVGSKFGLRKRAHKLGPSDIQGRKPGENGAQFVGFSSGHEYAFEVRLLYEPKSN